MVEYYCACGNCCGENASTFEAALAEHLRTCQTTRSSCITMLVRDEDFRDTTNKPTNPKDVAGTARAPLHTIPVTALVEESLALLEGMLKYGANNWTLEGVRASVYVAACSRHLFKWFFGQQRDPVTLVHHLASARACLGILLDAEYRQVLTDDRPPSLPKLDELFTSAETVAKQLFTLYGDKNPRHYTIKDST